MPDLAKSGNGWSYTLVGMGFALYGIAMIAYGTWRTRVAEAAIGGPDPSGGSDFARISLTAAGILLGAAAAALILFN